MASHAESGRVRRSLNSPAPRSQRAPSITTHSPLMYSAMSLIRKAARLVSSSWRPKRFMGWDSFACSSNCFDGMRRDHAPSVGNGPGAMAFKRIRYFDHSTAREVVMARTPAFAQAEGTTKPEPQFAEAYVVTMLSTLPPCFSAIHFLAKACVQWNVPLSTILTTALKALGLRVSVRAMKFPAALLTIVSMRP